MMGPLAQLNGVLISEVRSASARQQDEHQEHALHRKPRWGSAPIEFRARQGMSVASQYCHPAFINALRDERRRKGRDSRLCRNRQARRQSEQEAREFHATLDERMECLLLCAAP